MAEENTEIALKLPHLCHPDPDPAGENRHSVLSLDQRVDFMVGSFIGQ